jgi:hypothetical protein
MSNDMYSARREHPRHARTCACVKVKVKVKVKVCLLYYNGQCPMVHTNIYAKALQDATISQKIRQKNTAPCHGRQPNKPQGVTWTQSWYACATAKSSRKGVGVDRELVIRVTGLGYNISRNIAKRGYFFQSSLVKGTFLEMFGNNPVKRGTF